MRDLGEKKYKKQIFKPVGEGDESNFINESFALPCWEQQVPRDFE